MEANRPQVPGMDGGAPTDDPRTKAIDTAVAQLSDLVTMILEEMLATVPMPPAELDAPPLAPPTDFIKAPSPGAFSFDPGALGQPALEMMGLPL